MTRWRKKRLGDVAEVGSGAGFPIRYQGATGEEFPFLKVSDMNLSGNEIHIVRWNNTVSEQLRNVLRAKSFPAGSVIFPKIGAAIATNKKRILTRPSCVDNNVMAVVPHSAIIESEFLYTLFRRKDLSEFASQSNPPSMRKTVVEDWEIPLPPLDEQRRIVDILNRANGILRLRREALDKSRQLIPALFVEMFGDPVSNPKAWPVVPLADLLSFTTSGSRGWGKYYCDTGAKFIRVQNLTNNELCVDEVAHVAPPDGAETRRTKVQPGDVLLAITGAPGLVAVAPTWIGEAYVNQHVAILRSHPGAVISTYLWGFMAHPLGGQRQLGLSAYGQTRAGLGFAEVKAVKCAVPPARLQRQFAAQVTEIQATIAQQERMVEASEQLVAALMARLFDGAPAQGDDLVAAPA